mgnify:FL=1
MKASSIERSEASSGGVPAPYLVGGLCDIACTVRQWNQELSRLTGNFSDAFVQFLWPIWVVYL